MLQIINQAMMSGFTASQILKFISSKMPNLKQGIQQAEQSGFDAEKILKFLSQKIPHSKEGADKQINANDRYLSSIGLKTKEEKEQSKNKFLSGALQVGAGALGTYALSRAIPAGVSAVSGLLKPQSQSQLSQGAIQGSQQPISPQNMAPSQPPIPPASPAGMANSIPQPQGIPQAVNHQRDINKSVDIIKNLGQESSIKNMIEGGMTPKDIAGVLKVTMPKDKFKALEQQEGGIEGIIEDMKQSLQTSEQTTPEVAHEPEIEKEQLNEPETTIEPPKPIAKNSIVSSQHGIGEVKEIRNGKALVEVEGKLHKVDEDELIESPIPQKDMADLYDDLIQGIEKATGKEISRNVEWGGYDPNTNELAYKPHGSDRLYVYGDISSEDATLLTSMFTVRKSTGSNHIGAWEKDTKSPIGAAMYKLIQKLQAERGGKGSEYKNRYETIYDALEPAKKALKEKYAEAKKKAKKPRID